ncbi:Ochratoxinase [Exophiala dermatitidis]
MTRRKPMVPMATTPNYSATTSRSGQAHSRHSDVTFIQEEQAGSISMSPTTVEPPKDSDSAHLINADLLIPGRGEPRSKMSVIVQDGKITSVQPTSSVPPPFKKLPTTEVPVLLPGLWDCHTHLLGATSFNFSELLTTSPPALAGARISRNVHDILMSGFTSIRDLGGYALEVSKAVEEGTLVGPHIYSAGAAISQTSGHGDIYDLPSGFVTSCLGVRDTQANAFAPATGPLLLADGVDECRRAVRLLTRRGAQCIKVFASGGVLSIADDPLRQQFSLDELKVIVEEANRAGRIVAAHCHGKVGIMAALHAGCHTIEHGTYMDEECVELMKRKGAVYVPTRTIVKIGVDHPELMSPESYRKMLETAKHHRAAYRLAVRSGVKIALGTDLGISAPTTHPLALGNSGGELAYAVTDGGMDPLAAIEAATAMGPEVLGDLGMAPKTGQIAVGYDADLIALTANPLHDMDLFKDRKNITHVWKSGKLFKSPTSAAAASPL